MIHVARKRFWKPVAFTDLPVNEETKLSNIKLSILEYSAESVIVKENVTIKECLEHLETPPVTWIQVYGTSDSADVVAIGKHFNIHPLAIEDILNNIQRPKLDIYANQLFIIARALTWIANREELLGEQISLVVGDKYLISFSETELPLFKAIKERLKHPNTRIKDHGPDYLAYALLDAIVDQYFVVLEAIDIKFERLENDLIRTPKSTVPSSLQNAKRTLIFLRRSIWPLRDVISQLQHRELPLVNATTQLYLGDIYDHIIQIIDVIEGFRDVLGGMLDIYLSNINIRTNEIMKFLTVVSTIFVPLTFVASIYGMNFDHMPELRSPWGYPAVLTFMISMAIGMLIYFRRKKWI